MGLFGNFNLKYKDETAPEWYGKLTKIFGDLEQEEQKDEGHSVFDPVPEMKAQGEHADVMGAYFYGNMRRYIQFEETSKVHKLNIYRQMSMYTEIKYALNMIADELINYNDLTGNVGRLIIKNDKLHENINKKENIMREWNKVFHELLDFNNTGRDAVMSFLISGELIYEKAVNKDKTKEGLKRVRRIKPDYVFPVLSADMEDIEVFQIKNLNDNSLQVLPRSQLAYINWDYYTQNADNGEIMTLSYLEPVKKVWRQLQLLEEAIIIYRIVRAPERRIFRVATGNMPRAQAEQYVQKMMRAYRQKKLWNTSTGEIDGQNNIMAMLEDYWFAQPENGNPTEVDTLPGGEQLGEITDLNYFLEKLYRVLEIPSNRRLDSFAGGQQYHVGNVGEVSHQDVKFSKMITRIRRKVTTVIFDIFKTQLQLKGLWKQYNLKDSDFSIELHKNDFFEEMKRAQVEEMRLNAWGTVSSYVGDFFSKEMAIKHFLKWSDEEYEENRRLLQKEREEQQEMDDAGGGGFGF